MGECSDEMKIEAKVLLDDSVWSHLQERIPSDADDKKREIWFFDTEGLDLLRHELVLRLRIRRKKDKERAESTVKWRRLVPPFPEVRRAWCPVKGFKAELDATLDETTPAWSVDHDVQTLQVAEAALLEPATLHTLFNEHQRLLAGFAFPILPWGALQALGPIASQSWELSKELTLERWTLNGASILELSTRGPVEDAPVELLRKTVEDWGLSASRVAGGKTAWAFRQRRAP